MGGLDLRLLGPPRVLVRGGPLEVDTRKATALLAYVAMEGPATRERLAALLWPDSGESHARGSLRRTLSVLNRGIAGPWFRPGRDLVGLDGDWTCDAVALRSHLAAVSGHEHAPSRPCPDCLPELEAAAGLADGDFLEGFTLRDSAAFDTWQAEQAEALRRDRRMVLQLLVQGLVGLGRLDEAVDHARRQVELDPLQEPAQRRLMLLLAWTGQRNEAVRQYRRLTEALERELGVEPLAETAALAERIAAGDAPPPPADPELRDFPARPGQAVASPEPPGRAALPLVGRRRQVETLVAAAAVPDAGRLLAIRGEPGAGKTRLAAELAARLRDDGRRTVTVRCHPSDEHLAYAPVAAALREAVADAPAGWLGSLAAHWRAEAARLVPALADPRDRGPVEPLTTPGARTRFVEGVWQALESALAGPAGPGLLVVDDLHRADAATLDLLAYGCVRLAQRAVVVAACWRDTAMPDDHPWREAVADALDDGRAVEVPVPRLERAEVSRLVGAARPDAGDELVERLYAETEGLPLAVVAYLDELDQDPDGPPDGGPWSLPRSLAAVYRERVAALPGVARQVLGTAAVIGRSFDPETVVAASGRTDEEVVAALEELVAHGLITEAPPHDPRPDARYDFAHDKIRTVVYDETGLARRRLLHRRVADTLRTRPGQDAAVIARHERLGGRAREAAEAYAQAADQARRLSATTDALRHLRQALDLGHPDPAGLHEAVGDLQVLEGDYAGARASFEAAGALADDRAALAVLEHKTGRVLLRAGDHAGAQAWLDGALQTAGEDAPTGLLAGIHADRALAEAGRGAPARAEEAARRSLALAERAVEQTGDRLPLAQARNILGVLARRAGRGREAQRHLEISADLAARLREPDARVAALNNLALALRDAGRLDHAIAHERTAVDLCGRLGDRHREAALHSNLADLLHADGRDEEAMVHLKRSAALFAALGREPERAPELWRLTEW